MTVDQVPSLHLPELVDAKFSQSEDGQVGVYLIQLDVPSQHAATALGT